LNELAKDLQIKDIKISVFSQDLSLPGSAEKLYQDIVSAGLEIDLLVNNA
jgi:short-subunit dehydrogenase